MAPNMHSDDTVAPRRSARIAGVVADPNARINKEPALHKRTASNQTPKARPPPVIYECSTCYDDLPSRAFPDDLCSSSCEHLINTCKKCIKHYINHQLEHNIVDSISCPECPEKLEETFVKKYATTAAYKRWDELERRMTAEKTPGWRWCLAPKCRSGQVHEPSIVNPKANVMSESDRIFTCNDCGFSCCVLCDRPDHTGSCEDQINRAEEEASLIAVHELSKPCPGCQRPIEKTAGCDAVICTKCKTRFCYVCRARYEMTTIAWGTGRITHGDGCRYKIDIDLHAT